MLDPESGLYSPVGSTEFARDPAFGFAASHLAAWVEEKTRGGTPAASVGLLDLDLIRTGGPLAVRDRFVELAGRRHGAVAAADAVVMSDMRAIATGAALAEAQGVRIL